MGWGETRGAWTLALLLVLLLNLLAEPLHSTKEGISLETVISAAVVELLKAEEDMKKVEHHHNQTHPKEVEFGPCTVTCGKGKKIRKIVHHAMVENKRVNVQTTDHSNSHFFHNDVYLLKPNKLFVQIGESSYWLEALCGRNNPLIYSLVFHKTSNCYVIGRGMELFYGSYFEKMTYCPSAEMTADILTKLHGIGMREVILTNGCPVNEKKCIVRIEECKGPPDCGWGKPLAETLESVKMPCIFVPPENRFQYTWKMLIPDQQSLIIPNDSAVLEVHRDTHPVAFECDTTEDEELIASVKYTVYSTDELETRRSRKPSANAVLVFVLVTGIIICVGVLFAIIFVVFNWAAIKVFCQTKVWKSRESMSSSLVRSSSGLTPTADLSQISQLGSGSHRQVSYHEWNEPLRGGGGGETEEERGNN